MWHTGETAHNLQNFITFIKRQCRTQTLKIRTDNGMEFFTHAFTEFLKKGVSHNHSTRYNKMEWWRGTAIIYLMWHNLIMACIDEEAICKFKIIFIKHSK